MQVSISLQNLGEPDDRAEGEEHYTYITQNTLYLLYIPQGVLQEHGPAPPGVRHAAAFHELDGEDPPGI